MQILMGVCGILYVVALLMSPGALVARLSLDLLSVQQYPLLLLGASGAFPVIVGGHWWTLLSASLLHASLLHIVFNMLWVRDLAPPVAKLYGAGRMVLIWTAASVGGFGLSTLAQWFVPPLPFFGPRAMVTVGASAAIFGLLGALVCYGRRSGQSTMRQQVWKWAVVMFIFGIIMPGVDNFAHFGGFLGGYVAARWLDPLRPERPQHVLLAVVCLIATLGAVVASILTVGDLTPYLQGNS
ncbi:MAG: rhomboid family intramembrane serine protease [Thermoanaerobaculia bacterium]